MLRTSPSQQAFRGTDNGGSAGPQQSVTGVELVSADRVGAGEVKTAWAPRSKQSCRSGGRGPGGGAARHRCALSPGPRPRGTLGVALSFKKKKIGGGGGGGTDVWLQIGREILMGVPHPHPETQCAVHVLGPWARRSIAAHRVHHSRLCREPAFLLASTVLSPADLLPSPFVSPCPLLEGGIL